MTKVFRKCEICAAEFQVKGNNLSKRFCTRTCMGVHFRREPEIVSGTVFSATEWKDVLTASLKRAKVVPGLDGGFVVVGQSTSRMTKSEFSELLELVMAFGAQQGVQFSEVEVS